LYAKVKSASFALTQHFPLSTTSGGFSPRDNLLLPHGFIQSNVVIRGGKKVHYYYYY